MSNYSNFWGKCAPAGNQVAGLGGKERLGNFEANREKLGLMGSCQVNSPRSRKRIEQTFEETLKSTYFFKKPDIVPFPYLNTEVQEPSIESTDHKYKDLLEELEREKNMRKAAEKENETLRDKLSYLSDLESQYEVYHLKSLKIPDLTLEIEKLNLKIKLLQEENEELRRKIRGTYDNNLHLASLCKDLEKQKQINDELLKQLSDLKDTYEDLRKSYTKEIKSQKARFSKLSQEKNDLESKLIKPQEKPLSFSDLSQDPDPDLDPDDRIQAKIRDMKTEYRDKLKSLESRLPSEPLTDPSELRLKLIEDRLASLQVKLSAKEPIVHLPGSQTSRGSTPVRGRFSPGSTFQTSDRSPPGLPNPNPYPYPYPQSSNPDKVHASIIRSPARLKVSFAQSFKSPPRQSPSSKSASRAGSPSIRSSPGHKLTQTQSECEVCVRRHGHEWARGHSPIRGND